MCLPASLVLSIPLNTVAVQIPPPLADGGGGGVKRGDTQERMGPPGELTQILMFNLPHYQKARMLCAKLKGEWYRFSNYRILQTTNYCETNTMRVC
jgi:hypothetical protein